VRPGGHSGIVDSEASVSLFRGQHTRRAATSLSEKPEKIRRTDGVCALHARSQWASGRTIVAAYGGVKSAAFSCCDLARRRLLPRKDDRAERGRNPALRNARFHRRLPDARKRRNRQDIGHGVAALAVSPAPRPPALMRQPRPRASMGGAAQGSRRAPCLLCPEWASVVFEGVNLRDRSCYMAAMEGRCVPDLPNPLRRMYAHIDEGGLLTTAELCRRLGISEARYRRLEASGVFPRPRFWGRWPRPTMRVFSVQSVKQLRRVLTGHDPKN